METDSVDKWLPPWCCTIREAAATLQMHPSFVKRLIKDGALEAFKPHQGLWAIDRTSLDAYLHSAVLRRNSESQSLFS